MWQIKVRYLYVHKGVSLIKAASWPHLDWHSHKHSYLQSCQVSYSQPSSHTMPVISVHTLEQYSYSTPHTGQYCHQPMHTLIMVMQLKNQSFTSSSYWNKYVLIIFFPTFHIYIYYQQRHSNFKFCAFPNISKLY